MSGHSAPPPLARALSPAVSVSSSEQSSTDSELSETLFHDHEEDEVDRLPIPDSTAFKYDKEYEDADARLLPPSAFRQTRMPAPGIRSKKRGARKEALIDEEKSVGSKTSTRKSKPKSQKAWTMKSVEKGQGGAKDYAAVPKYADTPDPRKWWEGKRELISILVLGLVVLGLALAFGLGFSRTHTSTDNTSALIATGASTAAIGPVAHIDQLEVMSGSTGGEGTGTGMVTAMSSAAQTGMGSSGAHRPTGIPTGMPQGGKGSWSGTGSWSGSGSWSGPMGSMRPGGKGQHHHNGNAANENQGSHGTGNGMTGSGNRDRTGLGGSGTRVTGMTAVATSLSAAQTP